MSRQIGDPGSVEETGDQTISRGEVFAEGSEQGLGCRAAQPAGDFTVNKRSVVRDAHLQDQPQIAFCKHRVLPRFDCSSDFYLSDLATQIWSSVVYRSFVSHCKTCQAASNWGKVARRQGGPEGRRARLGQRRRRCELLREVSRRRDPPL